MARIGLSLSSSPVLEVTLLQRCELCRQAIRTKRQMPFNALLIMRVEMCPSCRQQITPRILRRPEYQEARREFLRDCQWDGGRIFNMAKAHKTPLSSAVRPGRTQTASLEVGCPLGCGVTYVLFYDPRLTDSPFYCHQQIQTAMGACGSHPAAVDVPGVT